MSQQVRHDGRCGLLRLPLWQGVQPAGAHQVYEIFTHGLGEAEVRQFEPGALTKPDLHGSQQCSHLSSNMIVFDHQFSTRTPDLGSPWAETPGALAAVVI